MSTIVTSGYGWMPNLNSWCYRAYRWGRVRGFVAPLAGKNRCGFHWLVASVPVAWFFQAQIAYRWMSPFLATFALALLGYIGVNIAVQPTQVVASALEGTLSALFSVGLFGWLTMRRRPTGEMTVYDGGALITAVYAFMGPFIRRMSSDGNEVTLVIFAATAAVYLLFLAWVVLFPFKRQVGSAVSIPFVWLGRQAIAGKLWLCPPVIPPEPDPYSNN